MQLNCNEDGWFALEVSASVCYCCSCWFIIQTPLAMFMLL